MSTTRQTYLKRYTSLSAALHLLHSMKINLLDPKSWDDKNDVYFMDAYMRYKKAKFIAAVCFTQATETYHHWKVFAPSSDGVCIEFDKNLTETAARSIPNVFLGNMDYKTIKQVQEFKNLKMDRLPFTKRKPYEDESEFRVGCTSSDTSKEPASISINSKFIRRITLSPWMHQSIANSVKKTIKSIPSCGNLSVVRSTLVGNLEWQQAAAVIEAIEELV